MLLVAWSCIYARIFRVVLAAQCALSSDHEIIRERRKGSGSVRKDSSLVDVSLGLAARPVDSRHVLALRREIVCPVTSLSRLFLASSESGVQVP
jgi:hypothetical protein